MRPEIELRHLRIFTELARTGNYTRAAAALQITQSAVSHAMKKLETQLGCQLVHKKGKSTNLTPQGRVFHSHAFKVLESMERATQCISAEGSEFKGVLTVIFSVAMAHFILAPVLREFRESYPNVFVSVLLEDNPRAIQAIEEGASDLAVVVDHQVPSSLKFHFLFQDELQFVFSPLHAWSEKPRLTSADMAREHFLLYQRNSLAFTNAQDFFLQTGVKLSSYIEIPSFELMKEFAYLGLGVAMMPTWVAGTEIRDGVLLARPLPNYRVQGRWGIVHQLQRPLRQPEQTFIGLCRLACEYLSTGLSVDL